MQTGAPLGRLYGAIQDLSQCIMYLIKMGGLLSVSMLSVGDEKPVTSLTPMEKTRPPDEPDPKEEV